MTHILSIEYSEDVLLSTGLPERDFNEEARFLLAAKLYELGRLSSGQAATLCGKGRVEFLLSLPRIGVSLSNLRPEDATSELEFLRHGKAGERHWPPG
jgi:predicted HTH domain antitoxin